MARQSLLMIPAGPSMQGQTMFTSGLMNPMNICPEAWSSVWSGRSQVMTPTLQWDTTSQVFVMCVSLENKCLADLTSDMPAQQYFSSTRHPGQS